MNAYDIWCKYVYATCRPLIFYIEEYNNTMLQALQFYTFSNSTTSAYTHNALQYTSKQDYTDFDILPMHLYMYATMFPYSRSTAMN